MEEDDKVDEDAVGLDEDEEPEDRVDFDEDEESENWSEDEFENDVSILFVSGINFTRFEDLLCIHGPFPQFWGPSGFLVIYGEFSPGDVYSFGEFVLFWIGLGVLRG